MRILVETITGAGVGVGSPPKMPQATVTGRTRTDTIRSDELLAPIASIPPITRSRYYTLGGESVDSLSSPQAIIRAMASSQNSLVHLGPVDVLAVERKSPKALMALLPMTRSRSKVAESELERGEASAFWPRCMWLHPQQGECPTQIGYLSAWE